MVFIRYFFIFWKLLFQSCVSVNDADKPGNSRWRSLSLLYNMQMEAEVESTFLTLKLQSFKVKEFVFLVLEKKIETLLNYYCQL